MEKREGGGTCGQKSPCHPKSMDTFFSSVTHYFWITKSLFLSPLHPTVLLSSPSLLNSSLLHFFISSSTNPLYSPSFSIPSSAIPRCSSFPLRSVSCILLSCWIRYLLSFPVLFSSKNGCFLGFLLEMICLLLWFLIFRSGVWLF